MDNYGIKNVHHEIDILKRQVKRLREQAIQDAMFIDTVSSPFRKRLWWWIGGYYFRKVGRWYDMNTKLFKFWYKIAKIIKCT